MAQNIGATSATTEDNPSSCSRRSATIAPHGPTRFLTVPPVA